ncbi:MAG: UDP-N-acetylglucosamine 1-carboxyvinyltransferase [Bacilli bacterium]|nr:UDP-N-acetylglucosamine 1-carboxyvinyltransferase [Bacilli bacterium]
MAKIIIEGGNELSGNITIGGAKNSAVALIPASLLCDGEVTIDNVPNISDIDALNEILLYLGATVQRDKTTIRIDSRTIKNKSIPQKISKKLRASYYFMAALLGKYKKVEMYFPGGCKIGARPIDQTLKAFKALGAKIIEDNNKYTITAEELKGTTIYLDMPSVGATINTIIASCKAKGLTILRNAAKEPEIVNVATFLNQMGAKIRGAGTSEIKIYGVEKLDSCYTEVIPDRIEAGTYVILGALVGNNLKIENIIPDHIKSLTSKLTEMGIPLNIDINSITVSKSDNLKSVNVRTLGYPGFPTDLQQPLTALLTQCVGTSSITETIYENRFQNVLYLNNMGADIKINDKQIKITGPTPLHGEKVTATDLRAGACLILAALKANNTTEIDEIEHVLRGYENIVEKLRSVGAKIKIIE